MNAETIESLQKILNNARPSGSINKVMQDPINEIERPMLYVSNFEGSHNLLYNDYDHPEDMYNRANNTKPGTLVFCKNDLSIAKRTNISADDCGGNYSLCWDFYINKTDDPDIPWHTLSIPE